MFFVITFVQPNQVLLKTGNSYVCVLATNVTGAALGLIRHGTLAAK